MAEIRKIDKIEDRGIQSRQTNEVIKVILKWIQQIWNMIISIDKTRNAPVHIQKNSDDNYISSLSLNGSVILMTTKYLMQIIGKIPV